MIVYIIVDGVSSYSWPGVGSGALYCFLAECRLRRLNQASFVLLYFVLFAFLVVFGL